MLLIIQLKRNTSFEFKRTDDDVLVKFFPAYAEVNILTDRDQDGRGRDLNYFTRPKEEEEKKTVNIN